MLCPSLAARRYGLFLRRSFGTRFIGVTRTNLTLTLALSALALGGRAAAQQPDGAPAASLVFRDVTVIDVQDGRHLSHQTVLVVGSRIQALGPAAAVRVPLNARIVNARGKYLIPGLWDMHFHQLATGRVNAPVDSAISHPLLIANGVTGIRDAGSTVPLARLGQWKRAIAAGAQVGPRMVVAGPMVDEGYDGEKDGHVGASTPEKMRHLVDSLKTAGADFIKTYNLNPAMYFVVAAEARRLGIPFGGHGTGVLADGLTLSDSGAVFLDHVTWLLGDRCGDWHADSLKVEQCAAAGQHFRRNGTWLVPTFISASRYSFPARALELHLRYTPEGLYAHDNTSRAAERAAAAAAPRKTPRWRTDRHPRSAADWVDAMRWYDSLFNGRFDTVTRKLIRYEPLHQVPIVAGTDAVLTADASLPLPGFSLHDQLAIYVANGVAPLAALQAATLNPALALHATDSLGTVAVGKLADLVLLDADPLADIWSTTKIRAVVANGRYFDRAALDRLLHQAEREAHQPSPASR